MSPKEFQATALGVVFPTTFAGVATVLLICFIVVLPIDSEFEEGLPRAESADTLKGPFDAVHLRVNGDGTVTLMWRQVLTADLGEALRASRFPSGPKWAIVSADARVPYGRVKAVLGKLEEAGVSRITVRTSKIKAVAGVWR